MEQFDDQAIIARAKQEPEKFALLYDKYVSAIYRYFLLRTSHKQTAEDLTSEVFFKAVEAFPRYEARAPFGAWLFKIAHNTLVNNYRRAKFQSLELSEDISDQTDIVGDLDHRLNLEKMKTKIAELPERDREIVTLRIASELQFSEISEVLKISEGAARTAYHRAVQKLIN